MVAAMVQSNDSVAVPSPSAAYTVTAYEPAARLASSVPVMSPVVGSMADPVGRPDAQYVIGSLGLLASAAPALSVKASPATFVRSASGLTNARLVPLGTIRSSSAWTCRLARLRGRGGGLTAEQGGGGAASRRIGFMGSS